MSTIRTLDEVTTVRASQLTTDHKVVDVHGGIHELRKLRVLKGGDVLITREDGWQDRFSADGPVTVLLSL